MLHFLSLLSSNEAMNYIRTRWYCNRLTTVFQLATVLTIILYTKFTATSSCIVLTDDRKYFKFARKSVSPNRKTELARAKIKNPTIYKIQKQSRKVF